MSVGCRPRQREYKYLNTDSGLGCNMLWNEIILGQINVGKSAIHNNNKYFVKLVVFLTKSRNLRIGNAFFRRFYVSF